MDWAQLWAAADKLGVVGLLLLLAFGGYRRWWVFGWTYRDKVAESEKFERLWNESMDRMDRTIHVAEVVTQPKPSPRLRAASQIRARKGPP